MALYLLIMIAVSQEGGWSFLATHAKIHWPKFESRSKEENTIAERSSLPMDGLLS